MSPRQGRPRSGRGRSPGNQPPGRYAGRYARPNELPSLRHVGSALPPGGSAMLGPGLTGDRGTVTYRVRDITSGAPTTVQRSLGGGSPQCQPAWQTVLHGAWQLTCTIGCWDQSSSAPATSVAAPGSALTPAYTSESGGLHHDKGAVTAERRRTALHAKNQGLGRLMKNKAARMAYIRNRRGK